MTGPMEHPSVVALRQAMAQYDDQDPDGDSPESVAVVEAARGVLGVFDALRQAFGVAQSTGLMGPFQ